MKTWTRFTHSIAPFVAIAGCTGADSSTEPARPISTGSVSGALSPSCAAFTWTSCQATLAPGDEVDVRRFGAVSNDGNPDTSNLQHAICCAHAMAVEGGTTRAVVNFSSGTYELDGSLKVMPGLTLKGGGAVLKYVATAADGTQALTTASDPYSGALDSLPLIIEDFVIDGSAATGTSGAGVWLGGSLTSAGKLVAIVKNMTFRGLPWNALVITNNVSAHVENVTAKEIKNKALFIHDLTSSMDPEAPVRVFVHNFLALKEATNAGSVLVDGYGRFFLDNFDVDGGVALKLATGRDSTLLASNIHAPNGPFSLQGNKAVVRISNSLFGTTANGTGSYPENLMSQLGQVVFSRTTFRGREVGEQAGPIRVVNIGGDSGGSLQFNDCTFEVDTSVEASDSVVGVYAQGSSGQKFRLIIRGATFETNPVFGGPTVAFDQAISIIGTDLLVQGGIIKGDASTTGIALFGSQSDPTTALIDGVRTLDAVGCLTDTGNDANSTYNTVTHRDIHIPVQQDCDVASSVTFSQAVYRGQRVFYGPNAVNQAFPCVSGDLYRRQPVPVASTSSIPIEWACAAPGQTDRWLPVTSLPAIAP